MDSSMRDLTRKMVNYAAKPEDTPGRMVAAAVWTYQSVVKSLYRGEPFSSWFQPKFRKFQPLHRRFILQLFPEPTFSFGASWPLSGVLQPNAGTKRRRWSVAAAPWRPSASRKLFLL